MKENRECWWCKKSRNAHTFMRVKNKNHELCWWCYQSYLKGRYHGTGINRTSWSSMKGVRNPLSAILKQYGKTRYAENRIHLLMYEQLIRLLKKDQQI